MEEKVARLLEAIELYLGLPTGTAEFYLAESSGGLEGLGPALGFFDKYDTDELIAAFEANIGFRVLDAKQSAILAEYDAQPFVRAIKSRVANEKSNGGFNFFESQTQKFRDDFMAWYLSAKDDRNNPIIATLNNLQKLYGEDVVQLFYDRVYELQQNPVYGDAPFADIASQVGQRALSELTQDFAIQEAEQEQARAALEQKQAAGEAAAFAAQYPYGKPIATGQGDVDSIAARLSELENAGVESPDASKEMKDEYAKLRSDFVAARERVAETAIEEQRQRYSDYTEAVARAETNADRIARGLPPLEDTEMFPGPSAEDIAAAQAPTVPGGPQFSQAGMVSRQANARPADLRTLEQQPIPDAIANDQFASFLNNLYGRGGEDQLVAQDIAQQAPDLFRQFQAQVRARNERAAETRDWLEKNASEWDFTTGGDATKPPMKLQTFQQQIDEFKPQPGLYSAAQLAGEPAIDFGSFLETLASDTGFRQNLRASRQGRAQMRANRTRTRWV